MRGHPGSLEKPSMNLETIQGVRRVLLEISNGLWIGHHITRLNSYGPELFSALRDLVESEPDDRKRSTLCHAQSKLLVRIKKHMAENAISPCLDPKEIDNYLDWLDKNA